VLVAEWAVLHEDELAANRERWTGIEPERGWGMEAIDTSKISPEQVAAEIVAWCRRALRGEAPVMLPAGDYDRQLEN
jgi:hypothetical protein